MINQLGKRVLAIIFSYTGIDLFGKLIFVCKDWNEAIKNSKVYHEAMLYEICKPNWDKLEIPINKRVLIPEFSKNKTWPEIFKMKHKIVFAKDGNSFYEGSFDENNKYHGQGIIYKKKMGLFI